MPRSIRWLPGSRQVAWIKVAVFLICLVPLARLVYGAVGNTLGANPIDNIRNTRTIEQVWISGKRAF